MESAEYGNRFSGSEACNSEHDDSATEAAEDSQDEEADKRQFGIYQCLPVDDAEPDWDSGEPESVEEYLRRVRHEARQLPSIVTSDIDPRQYDHHRTEGYALMDHGASLAECPPEYKPSLPWVRRFLAKFAVLRRHLQREYELSTGQVAGFPLRVTYGPAMDAPSRREMHAMSLDPPSALMPQLAELAGLDQVTIVRRLTGAVHEAVAAEAITVERAATLYALSARLERPLHGDTCAAYRTLLRRCAALRARLPNAHDPLLPHLNILIAVAGAYFGQDEELAAVWEEDEELMD